MRSSAMAKPPAGLVADDESSLPNGPIRLYAGPWSLEWVEGQIRYARVGDAELIRRVYGAVRGPKWETIPARVELLSLDQTSAGFGLCFDSRHEQGEVAFHWRGTVHGSPAGELRFDMEGEALSTFQSNRIGLCVLYPLMTTLGRAFAAEHCDGGHSEGSFPLAVSPHQPVRSVRAMTHEPQPGLRVRVQVDGDIFEMEDQRNWADGSFKLYSRPLEQPFPVTLAAGTRIRQSVIVTVQGKAGARRTQTHAPAIDVDILPEPVGKLPRCGLGAADDRLIAREQSWLRKLRPHHLHVDLHLDRAETGLILRRAALQASALRTGLEVALFLGSNPERGLSHLRNWLRLLRPPVRQWLIFPEENKFPACTPELLESLRRWTPGVPIGGGSREHFAELNRRPPADIDLDALVFPVCPQVHLTDDDTWRESLESLPSLVATVAERHPGRSIWIGPVELIPASTLPPGEGRRRSPESRMPTDTRQMSLLAAGWTLGGLVALRDAQRVTWYPCLGYRGIIQRGCRLSESRFPKKGCVYPLYHVLADAAEFSGAEVFPIQGGRQTELAGVALRQSGRFRLLLANLMPEGKRIVLHGLPSGASLRLLDRTNCELAMREPEEFRDLCVRPLPASGKETDLELPPFAYACIDASDVR